MKRVLRFKIFLGSTTEEIEESMSLWLKENQTCPGNYVDSKLYKLGSVYQMVFWYCELIK